MRRVVSACLAPRASSPSALAGGRAASEGLGCLSSESLEVLAVSAPRPAQAPWTPPGGRPSLLAPPGFAGEVRREHLRRVARAADGLSRGPLRPAVVVTEIDAGGLLPARLAIAQLVTTGCRDLLVNLVDPAFAPESCGSYRVDLDGRRWQRRGGDRLGFCRAGGGGARGARQPPLSRWLHEVTGLLAAHGGRLRVNVFCGLDELAAETAAGAQPPATFVFGVVSAARLAAAHQAAPCLLAPGGQVVLTRCERGPRPTP